ncbi:sigma-70 family RNA polymerase sigma factor [Novosphingobium mangrovi (ex Hu et al. 2023)]|uniref:Sigma-70 family RNA polymerase sigma factor n=1 Tax=Novosphingobium mangrovi (ex Hu et al. 2023) TaxID=2930094 RepID=A0ABT0AGB0_9SPHN|nr:sigma-70 family RNA polymerase sigma factor [Novosphingobium mangrovi (ex Hu et al. 2023)]MCJ1962219.1 sigma-70 family RNA polymerase sigma factor [Novosphingobium mangrovi (ex Hu et al. 2023)]
MKQDQTVFTPPTYSVGARSPRLGGHREEVADRVRRFLPMVRRLAWHVNGTGRPGIELEDLMQAGLVALTECAQKHSGPTEDGFAAYAKLRVRGAMVDLVRKTVPMSRGASERRRKIEAKEHELRAALGRAPSLAELAEALGMAEMDLAAMQDSSQPMRFESIDEVYSDQNLAFATEERDSLDILADAEMREAVIAALGDLPERLRLVISLYFVEELNLSEIAEVLQVSVPRVHQLKAQALTKLRESLAGVADIL